MSGGGVGESGGDRLELSSLHEAAPLLGMLSQFNLFRTRAYASLPSPPGRVPRLLHPHSSLFQALCSPGTQWNILPVGSNTAI